MPTSRRIFGNAGEDFAERFLERSGFTIVDRQVRCPFGEIDLVAEEGEEMVFIEVKTRSSMLFGHPEESVTPTKLRKIFLTAEWYLRRFGREVPYRIDVVAIDTSNDPPDIRHIRGVEL